MKKNITVLLISLLSIACGWYVYTNVLVSSKPVAVCEEKVLQHNTVALPADPSVKRRKFLQNKLWRDKAASGLEKYDGAIIHRRILNPEEHAAQLMLKVKEEADEVANSATDKELISEIGDLLEVIDCIIAVKKLSRDEIMKEKNKKRDERGSYLAGEFVLVSEYLPGSYGEWYSLKDPNKYIEIID